MLKNKFIVAYLAAIFALFLSSCSNQKNTKTTRLYHAVNARYNTYYNAEQAYIEALKAKKEAYKDNLSELIYLEPYYDEEQKVSGFDITIDKTTKAIKLHSIQAKPERDPGKRSDQKYQEWLQQKEFNPFLKNVWLLMGKAEYQSLDYMRALSTFSYITRLYKHDPEVVVEAWLWMTKAYTQMGWYYEADNIFHKIKLAGGVPEKHKSLFAGAYANYLIRHKEYEQAIPYLEEAIRRESGIQKIRMKYLLGQLYTTTGNKSKAYTAFGNVQSLNAPYVYTFNAKLRQAENSDLVNKSKMLDMLGQMSKSSKNKEYLDQIFFIKGNIFLQNMDTATAVKNYVQAIESSTRKGYDKGIAALTLGDIYFKQRAYTKAQPMYTEALAILSKKDERYPLASLRSEVLDELVVHVEAIHLQDSLQHLVQLPEDERLKAINKLIADIKKKDKEEQDLSERNNRDLSDNTNALFNDPSNPRPNNTSLAQFGSNQSTFYFYNDQSLAQGKIAFQKRWGNRKLEDNWRLKNKRFSTFDESGLTQEDLLGLEKDVSKEKETAKPIEDKYSPEYYLQQLPFSSEAIAESNLIIEDAYFQMGLIYKTKLEDLDLAIDAFEMAMKRFPSTSNLEEIYYQLFLIYSQQNNGTMANVYRNKLILEFSQGNYAITLSDPDYENNLRNIGPLQNAIYEQTYNAYLSGQKRIVQDNYQLVKRKYPLSELMPKFMFLNALTYAQANDSKTFKNNLKELIEKYPKADVTPLASDMLKGLLDGKQLAPDGKPIRGMIWDIRFGDDAITDADTTIKFNDNPEEEYMLLLIYQSQTVDKNKLIYDVASYNFSTFILQTFDLSFSQMQGIEMLQVKGFKEFRDITDYINKAFINGALIDQLDPTIIPIPISGENYNSLMRGKNLSEYLEFFEKNYSKRMPQLSNYWKQQIIKNKESLSKEQENINTLIGKKDSAHKSIPEQPIDKEIKLPVNNIQTDKSDKNEKKSDGVTITAEDLLPDGTLDNAVEIVNDISKIANNPVDGIKNILNKVKNKPKLTKEEKQAAKEEKNRLKVLEKEQKAMQKAKEDSLKAFEKAIQDSIFLKEKIKIDLEKATKQMKIDERKAAEKAKEDARKEKQRVLKEKERARNERLKQKEAERKEKLKRREAERKRKEKQQKN